MSAAEIVQQLVKFCHTEPRLPSLEGMTFDASEPPVALTTEMTIAMTQAHPWTSVTEPRQQRDSRRRWSDGLLRPWCAGPSRTPIPSGKATVQAPAGFVIVPTPRYLPSSGVVACFPYIVS